MPTGRALEVLWPVVPLQDVMVTVDVACSVVRQPPPQAESVVVSVRVSVRVVERVTVTVS